MAKNSHPINVHLFVRKAYCRPPLCQHLQGTGTNKIEIKDLDFRQRVYDLEKQTRNQTFTVQWVSIRGARNLYLNFEKF